MDNYPRNRIELISLLPAGNKHQMASAGLQLYDEGGGGFQQG
jgi:hypothetical protein